VIASVFVTPVACTTEVMGVSQLRNVESGFSWTMLRYEQLRSWRRDEFEAFVWCVVGSVGGAAAVSSKAPLSMLASHSYFSLGQTSVRPSAPKTITSFAVKLAVSLFEATDRPKWLPRAAAEVSPPKRRQMNDGAIIVEDVVGYRDLE